MVTIKTAASPAKNSGITSLVNTQDIEGQTRPSLSSVGADHFSVGAAIYAPLFPENVGPNAQTTTATNQVFKQLALKIYPVPTSNYLKIEGLTKEMKALQVLNVLGQKVWEQDLENVNQPNLEVNINHLQNGYYIIHISGETGQFAQKIWIVR